MGKLKLVVPEYGINKIYNPSFEANYDAATDTFDGWDNLNGNAFQRTDQDAPEGWNVAQFITDFSSGAYTGMTQWLGFLDIGDDGNVYQFSCWMKWDDSSASDSMTGLGVYLTDNTYGGDRGTVLYPTAKRGEWVRLEMEVTGSSAYRIIIGTPDTIDDGCMFLVDGVQWVESNYKQTYFDGDTPGCFWSGAIHSSFSHRPLSVRNNGAIYDFQDDLGMPVERIIGAGYPTAKNVFNSLPNNSGQKYQSTSIEGSKMKLTLTVTENTLESYHDARQQLVNTLSPNTLPIGKPFRILYERDTDNGRDSWRWKDFFLAGGLEMNHGTAFAERLVLELESEDPFWYGGWHTKNTFYEGDGSSNWSNGWPGLGIRRTTGYDDGTGSFKPWDVGGIKPADHNGTITSIDGLLYDDRVARLYFCGDFLDYGELNSSALANIKYLGYWDVASTELTTFLRCGSSSDIPAKVYDMCLGPDNSIFFCGDFSAVASTANTKWVARYSADDDDFYGLASDHGFNNGINTGIHSIAMGPDGKLYAAGPGIASGTHSGAAVGVARFNFESGQWENVAGALPYDITKIRFAPNGDLWVGGDFSQSIGGVTTDNIFKIEDYGTAVGSAVPAQSSVGVVNDIFCDKNNDVYIATGQALGGYQGVHKLRGNRWDLLGGGVMGNPAGLAHSITKHKGKIYAVVSELDDTTTDSVLFVWDGTTWARSDIRFNTNQLYTDFPNTVYAYDRDKYLALAGPPDSSTDRMIPAMGLRIEADENLSTAPANISFRFLLEDNPNNYRTYVSYIESLTTNAVATLNKPMQVGEYLIVTLAGNDPQMVSNLYGGVWAATPNSNISDFYLKPGQDNDLLTQIFFALGGSYYDVTVGWHNTFWGID